MLEKAATMRRFEYYPLGKELKAETNLAKKQYQNSDNTFEFDEIIKKENCTKSNLIYDANHSFYRYYRDKKM